MLTTSWGGHLGWFELGGSRWFVKPVCIRNWPLTSEMDLLTFLQVTNFLNKMAREIDTSVPGVVEHPERLPGNIASHIGANKEPDTAPKPEFVSMRRKLALPLGL
jgi:hypothetical protein